jgi:hypothetical protein
VASEKYLLSSFTSGASALSWLFGERENSMLELLELFSSIGELLLSWRLYVSFAIAASLVFFVFMLVPSEIARWVICTPIAITGVVGGFYWQIKADIS